LVSLYSSGLNVILFFAQFNGNVLMAGNRVYLAGISGLRSGFSQNPGVQKIKNAGNRCDFWFVRVFIIG
jgi:hypothetical protein